MPPDSKTGYASPWVTAFLVAAVLVGIGQPLQAQTSQRYTAGCIQGAMRSAQSTCGGGGGGGGGGLPTPTPNPNGPVIGSYHMTLHQDGVSYWNPFSWCSNPNFSDKPGEGAGTMFGIMRANHLPMSYRWDAANNDLGSATPYILVGFHDGSFLNVTPRSNGYAVDSFDGTSETIWIINRPLEATSYFSTSIEQNANYDDAQIDGTTYVAGMYQGAPTATFMAAGLWMTTVANPRASVYYNFTDGANCSGMQTYAGGPTWSNWDRNYDYWATYNPLGQPNAGLTFSYTGGDYVYIHP